MRRRWSSILLIALLTTAGPVDGQAPATVARNSVYVELLGNAGLYSLNFDHLISDHVALRVGIGSWTSEGSLLGSSDEKTSVTSLPLMVNYLAGARRSRFEAGAGVLLGRKEEESPDPSSSSTRSASFVTLTATLGYRLQPLGRGLVFRIGFTPLLGLGSEADAYPDRGLFPSVGLSVGYAF